MIEVKVKPYCNNCENFKPDVETFTGYCFSESFVNHTIRCSHRDQCESMAQHIRNEIKIEKGE